MVTGKKCKDILNAYFFTYVKNQYLFSFLYLYFYTTKQNFELSFSKIIMLVATYKISHTKI